MRLSIYIRPGDCKSFAQHTDEDEFIGVQAFTPAELRRMVADGELYDAKTLCALYAAKVI